VSPDRPDRRIWLAAAIGLPLYAFLYDNATSLPAAMGYGWTRLTPLTRQVRLVETVVVCGLLVVALAHGISRPTRTLLIGSLVFFGLGMASFLHSSGVPVVDGARLLYMYLLPLFVFIIGLEAPWDIEAWTPAAITVLVWVVLSAAVSWFQFAWLGYPVGDDITGLNKDAHANGTLMMLVAIQLGALGLFLGQRKAIIAALGLLVTMVLCSVIKVMFFGVAALALLLWLYVRAQPRPRVAITRRGLQWGLVAAVTVTVVAIVFARVDAQNAERLTGLAEKLREDPAGLGPLQAHESAALKVARDLPTLILGLGPFRFANPISVGQVLDDTPLGKLASTEVLAVEDEHGEQTRITLSSSLLGELGWPAFLIVAVMYLAVWRAVWRACQSAQMEIRARAAACLACGTILALTAVCSLFGSLELLSVSWPVMLLSGIVCRMDARSLEPAWV
jgi:hypothetical protein